MSEVFWFGVGFFFFLPLAQYSVCKMLKPENCRNGTEYSDQLRSPTPSHLCSHSYQDTGTLLSSPGWPQLLALLLPPTATSPVLVVHAPSHKSWPQAASGPLELRGLHQRHASFLPLSPHRMRVPALAKPQDLPLSNLMLLCTVVFN